MTVRTGFRCKVLIDTINCHPSKSAHPVLQTLHKFECNNKFRRLQDEFGWCLSTRSIPFKNYKASITLTGPTKPPPRQLVFFQSPNPIRQSLKLRLNALFSSLRCFGVSVCRGSAGCGSALICTLDEELFITWLDDDDNRGSGCSSALICTLDEELFIPWWDDDDNGNSASGGVGL